MLLSLLLLVLCLLLWQRRELTTVWQLLLLLLQQHSCLMSPLQYPLLLLHPTNRCWVLQQWFLLTQHRSRLLLHCRFRLPNGLHRS